MARCQFTPSIDICKLHNQSIKLFFFNDKVFFYICTFQASTILICQCGFNKTLLRILIRWPSYILMPMFSIFTFGVEKVGNKRFLVCSRRWTLCNLAITIVGLIANGYFFKHLEDLADIDMEKLRGYGSGGKEFHLLAIVAASLTFLAIILYVIVMTVDSCTCLCCSCSVIKRSGLDLETLEVVDLDDLQPDSAVGTNISGQLQVMLQSI